ncbi:MAG: hypothetical protein PHI12_10115 [Dehalococcoidales bacterium]|nr:hypothetical protein [Dehalococcoidales bacterium]
MKTKLISKILGVGLALGLTLSLGAAFIAAPAAQADEMEWGAVNTPSWDDLVILPASDILDYAVGGDEGDIIYAVLELESECTEVGWYFDDLGEWGNFALVKSDDGGVTWSDITENVMEASSLPDLIVDPGSETDIGLDLVAVSPDDEDWVAVAGYYYDNDAVMPLPFVIASEDGGANFTYAHPVEDASAGTVMMAMMDMAVSPAVGSIHNIALAGITDGNGTDDGTVGPGAVFRLEAGTWLTGGWVDTRYYPGWNDSTEDDLLVPQWPLYSAAVIAVDFSPNFDMDDTIVCMSLGAPYDGVEPYNMPYLQEGTLNGDGVWNAEAGFGDAVLITDEGTNLYTFPVVRSMGFALPADFDGAEPADNNIYLYVDATDDISAFPDVTVKGYVFISEDGALTGRCGPSGDPILASIDVHGDADTCKAMVGVYAEQDEMMAAVPTPCAGVAVYHTVELDDCCPEWESACKDPSGPFMAVVSYTPDGEKAFATTTGSWSSYQGYPYELSGYAPDSSFNPYIEYDYGVPLDESAFSVSLDDAVSFNQIGLIDTDIDFLSDLAVCPDCSVLYLSTINVAIEYNNFDEGNLNGGYPCVDYDCCDPENIGVFACDSVWRSYDNGDTWERVYHGNWSDDPSGWDITNPPDFGDLVEDDNGQIDHRLWARQLLLRLPCDEDTECCTIYMGIQDTQDLFYSRDCGQCWNKAVNQKLVIQDFAVETENVVYILDEAGQVSTSTQYGRRPSDGVDTGLDTGHSIASCCAQGWVIVGGAGDEPVAWSEDGGETWDVTDDLPGDGDAQVHVACDPVCENIVYAALDGKGIYRTDLNEGAWDDLNAMEYDYTGIVVAREGTLYASSDQIIADTSVFCEDEYCERYIDGISTDFDCTYESNGCVYQQYSGVARNLTPCETDCCGTEDWDYLIAGMSADQCEGSNGNCDTGEDFDQNPTALKICGCLSPDTNSVLWAIDTYFYDVVGEGCGLLWSYEDCAAKHGPDLTSPEDGAIVACDVCSTCDGAAMTLKWERMCLACSYDIEIMDEDGNVIVDWIDEEITGDPPTFYFDYGLECGRTYTWHVREANTETDECVHSPWSETWSFTVEASSANAVKLIAPEQGDVVAQRTGVGFSWSSVYDATTYSFVLSASPDLSGALATADVSGTAYAYSGTLDYETTYYWQVTAWKDGTMLSQSDVGTFAVAAEEYIPPEPQPQEPPVINIPPTQQIVPTWIYAMIGIGAALIVVVIVLIVRSRR